MMITGNAFNGLTSILLFVIIFFFFLQHLKLFDQFTVTGRTLYGKAKKNNNNKKSINLKRLQNKAKKIKLRITKIVRGKRVYKTVKELKNQIKKNQIKKSNKKKLKIV